MIKMNRKDRRLLALRILLLLVLITCLFLNCINAQKKKKRTTRSRSLMKKSGRGNREQKNIGPKQQQMCVPIDETVRAKHKSCLLRPDTGPCRADILSWYYDGKKQRCYRFFWGGCQGNGNKFMTLQDCLDTCYLNISMTIGHIPYFCSLAFDFGNCFGQYNRWGWDPLLKTCRRRLYSGCGGNQNNFETKHECMANCLLMPNNTMERFNQYTTCIPFTIADLQ